MRNAATLAGVYDRGMTDYLSRMEQHYATADALRETRTVRSAEGVAVAWDSAAELRLWAHEQELAQAAWNASATCQRRWSRVMFRAYQHRCLLSIRDAHTPRRRELCDRQSLAQVAADHADKNRDHASNAPPGHLRDLSALATCHASNAPGLFTHPRQLETAPT